MVLTMQEMWGSFKSRMNKFARDSLDFCLNHWQNLQSVFIRFLYLRVTAGSHFLVALCFYHPVIHIAILKFNNLYHSPIKLCEVRL
jgi:hypothetical protein